MRAYAEETTRAIINYIGDSHFSVLLDESCDKLVKEQIVVIVRFVNKQGQVIERYFTVEHVTDTSAPSLYIKGSFGWIVCLLYVVYPFLN